MQTQRLFIKGFALFHVSHIEIGMRQPEHKISSPYNKYFYTLFYIRCMMSEHLLIAQPQRARFFAIRKVEFAAV